MNWGCRAVEAGEHDPVTLQKVGDTDHSALLHEYDRKSLGSGGGATTEMSSLWREDPWGFEKPHLLQD